MLFRSGVLSRTICGGASVANASVKAIEVESSWVPPDTLLSRSNLSHTLVLHTHLIENSPATRSANRHLVTPFPIRHSFPSHPKPMRSKFVLSARCRGVGPFARDAEQLILRLNRPTRKRSLFLLPTRSRPHSRCESAASAFCDRSSSPSCLCDREH
jgi:hypothetical protein